MASVELTSAQVVELVRQLPAEAKREVLLALAGSSQARADRMQLANEQLRRLAKERGLNWDGMTDDKRQAFVDDLIHEDRSCQP